LLARAKTTAGRTLLSERSENGNGKTTTSPALQSAA